MQQALRRMIVTHHSPDLDACASVWLLKRFDAQHYADAHTAFVDPGKLINPSEAERLGFQMHMVVHVDTGLGEFDHHQPERGREYVCAATLVYDYICRIHPDHVHDEALKELVTHIVDVDHFGEISWPDSQHPRYCFMLSSLLQGYESIDPHNDDSQLHYGLISLDSAYANLRHQVAAKRELSTGELFEMPFGSCLSVSTANDEVIKYSQKKGLCVVIKRDPDDGSLRIKARPDCPIDLKSLSDAILKLDQVGYWYYHPSGKMLLNGSRKQSAQKPSILSLAQVTDLFKQIYGFKV